MDGVITLARVDVAHLDEVPALSGPDEMRGADLPSDDGYPARSLRDRSGPTSIPPGRSNHSFPRSTREIVTTSSQRSRSSTNSPLGPPSSRRRGWIRVRQLAGGRLRPPVRPRLLGDRSGAAFRETSRSHHGEIQDRPHPFCLLVRNTPVLERVLGEIGMSTAFISADQPIGGWTTLQLLPPVRSRLTS